MVRPRFDHGQTVVRLGLGAFNDNVFKMVVSLVAVRMATGDPGRDLSIVSAVFILPFILLSGYAGQFPDVYSKRTSSS